MNRFIAASLALAFMLQVPAKVQAQDDEDERCTHIEPLIAGVDGVEAYPQVLWAQANRDPYAAGGIPMLPISQKEDTVIALVRNYFMRSEVPAIRVGFYGDNEFTEITTGISVIANLHGWFVVRFHYSGNISIPEIDDSYPDLTEDSVTLVNYLGGVQNLARGHNPGKRALDNDYRDGYFMSIFEGKCIANRNTPAYGGFVTHEGKWLGYAVRLELYPECSQVWVGFASFSDPKMQEILAVAEDAAAQITSTEDEGIPHTFSLKAPYPNPFNPVATIPLKVDRTQEIRVCVHDLLGREVVVLHEGITLQGEHTFTFAADRLPSGVYLVRARGEGATQTQRIILSK